MCCCGHWEGMQKGEGMKCRWRRREVRKVMGAQSFMSMNDCHRMGSLRWQLRGEFKERWEDYSVMALEEILLDSEELDFYVPSQISNSVILSRNIFSLIISCLSHQLFYFCLLPPFFLWSIFHGPGTEETIVSKKTRTTSLSPLPCSISTGAHSRFSINVALN